MPTEAVNIEERLDKFLREVSREDLEELCSILMEMKRRGLKIGNVVCETFLELEKE